MAKAEKMNRNNKPVAQKVVKKVKVQFSAGEFTAWSVTSDRRVSSHPTRDRCVMLAMRRGYEVAA